MNSIFVTIYFFEWRWLIDFLAKVDLTSLLLLIGVRLKSIEVKEWNLKNMIEGNIYWKKKFESEYKRHKWGEPQPLATWSSYVI